MDIYREPKITLVAKQVFSDHPGIEWSTDTGIPAEQLVEFGGRICYMSYGKGRKTNKEYIEHLLESGHGSVLEHAQFTFVFEGISRSLTHELIRHRAGFAYSQLSQRYVDESDAQFVMPPAMIGDAPLEAAWRAQVESAQASYVALVDSLMTRYAWVDDKVHRRKMAREAARGVLPNSTETKIVVTGNARAWRTMLELRSSEGAELEIRRMAVAVLRVLQTEAPAFFSDFEIYVAADRREAARLSYHKV